MAASPPEPDSDSPSPLELGQAAAAQLGGAAWELEAEAPEIGDETAPPAEAQGAPPASHPRSAPDFPRSPLAVEAVPPSPEQLVEAMLFVGGHPLTAAVACAAVR